MAHARAFEAALRRLGSKPTESALNVLTLATALALPTFAYVTLENVGAAAGRADAMPQMSAFLAPGQAEADRTRIEHELRATPGVQRLRFVGKDEALRELKAASGSTDLLAGLNANPLPDAYVVALGTRDPVQLEAIRMRVGKVWGVVAVEVDSAWVDRVNALIGAGELFTLLIGGLLCFAALTGILNTIRLQVLTQKDEIDVADLFGATRAFLRRPFLYFGMTQAGLGALAAWGIVAAGLYLIDQRLGGILSGLGLSGAWRGLAVRDGLALVFFGALLGWFGAFIAVSQHLASRRP
jgi:cell division transport system permease protein